MVSPSGPGLSKGTMAVGLMLTCLNHSLLERPAKTSLTFLCTTRAVFFTQTFFKSRNSGSEITSCEWEWEDLGTAIMPRHVHYFMLVGIAFRTPHPSAAEPWRCGSSLALTVQRGSSLGSFNVQRPIDARGGLRVRRWKHDMVAA